MTDDFITTVSDYRKNILEIAKKVKELKDNVQSQPLTAIEDRGERIANLMLAYRHLEDARMRLGKSIQAYDGGTSIYDK